MQPISTPRVAQPEGRPEKEKILQQYRPWMQHYKQPNNSQSTMQRNALKNVFANPET